MAATQKLQHILGTTAMRCSQGGLGKGGVPSLETPPPHYKRSTVTHSHGQRKEVAKQWWDIYITETERMEEPVRSVRVF